MTFCWSASDWQFKHPPDRIVRAWRWLVIRDSEKKEALAEIYRRAAGSYSQRQPRKPSRAVRRPE